MARECKHRGVEAIFDLSSSRSQSGGAKNITGFGTYIIVAVSVYVHTYIHTADSNLAYLKAG
jgi:hypothetical protein